MTFVLFRWRRCGWSFFTHLFRMPRQLSIGVAVLCLPWLRWAQPNLPRPIRVPLIFPIVYLLASLFVTIVPMIASPVETGYGVLMILSSVPVYVVCIAWKSKPKWFRRGMGTSVGRRWQTRASSQRFNRHRHTHAHTEHRSQIYNIPFSIGSLTQTLQKTMMVVRPSAK